MANVIKSGSNDETYGEQNTMILEPHSADIGRRLELFPVLEDQKQSLFGTFSHKTKPDPEYIRLESERSALNQETYSKVIKDRYKLIMEYSARRKEKEQNDRIKFANILNLNYEKNMETFQLSPTDVDNIKKNIQSLQNRHCTPGCVSKNQSEEFSDNHFEKIYWHDFEKIDCHDDFEKIDCHDDFEEIDCHDDFEEIDCHDDFEEIDCHDDFEEIYWHNGLNRFIKLNYFEINTNAVANRHACRVEDALKHMRNEQKERERQLTFTQVSQKLGIDRKTMQLFCNENEAIGTSFEELLTDCKV